MCVHNIATAPTLIALTSLDTAVSLTGAAEEEVQGDSPTVAGACSVYFDFPATSGAMPIARAAAAAASVADRLYVYGGIGVDSQPLSDMYIFDAGASLVQEPLLQRMCHCHCHQRHCSTSVYCAWQAEECQSTCWRKAC